MDTTPHYNYRLRKASRSERGQSVLVAVVVLFILAFLGTIFVTIVANNLQSAQQSRRSSAADTYAQAGIDFADRMLTTSVEGADWRPPLQYQMATTSNQPCPYYEATPVTTAKDTTAADYATDQCAAYATTAYNATSPLASISPKDPDILWLKQGFTRYIVNGGRFLLKLTYAPGAATGPTTTAPNSVGVNPSDKFIKIESIGLEGVVDPDDPTTFTTVNDQRRSELIAYKPIGIGDYALFITNKDSRSDVANLGVPSIWNTSLSSAAQLTSPGVYTIDTTSSGTSIGFANIPTTFGSSTAYIDPTTGSPVPGGGTVKSNMDLRLYGQVNAYLDSARGEDWEIGGNLTFDGFPISTGTSSGAQTVLKTQATQVTIFPDSTLTTAIPPATAPLVTTANPNLFPSNDPNYTTLYSLVRDGVKGSDLTGHPRDINRRNPPIIDALDPQSHLSRYAQIARVGTSITTGSYEDNSGPYTNTGVTSTVYIDNTTDLQPESSSFTLRDEWVDHSSPQSVNNWKGSLYTPPGASVVFGDVPGATPDANGNTWGVTITRNASATTGLPTWDWFNSDGSTSSVTATRIRFVYGPAPTAGYTQTVATDPIYYLNADNQGPRANTNLSSTTNINNDIVIYAEGNVRVRGVISNPTGSSDHHVTLVTNGVAYIDGSILKGRYLKADGTADTTTIDPKTEVSKSSLSILAKTYVCVNTTQFLPGYEDFDLNTSNAHTGEQGDDGYDMKPGDSLNFAAVYPQLYTYTGSGSSITKTAAPSRMYISSEGEGGDGFGVAQLFNPVSSATSGTPVTFGDDPAGPGSSTLNALYPNELDANTANTLTVPGLVPGDVVVPNAQLARRAIQGNTPYLTQALLQPFLVRLQADSISASAGWTVERAALLPGDIRIEAMMYAQDNSFFIIPGEWFNSNSSDTVDNYGQRNTFTSGSSTAPTGTYDIPTARHNDLTDLSFPFHGQPVDLKLTIFGSVSENIPANIGDQAAWMLKWGWIPYWHGNDFGATDAVTPHWNSIDDPGYSSSTANLRVQGLQFIYDPAAGLPYQQFTGGGSTSVYDYIRVDRYGRPLPNVPNLPVSPDLVYSGQEPGSSVSGI